jgi:hypothetical protein
VRLLRPPLEELPDVSACSERARGTAHEQRSDVVTLHDFSQHDGEFAPGCEIERVERWPVDDDGADARGCVDLESD